MKRIMLLAIIVSLVVASPLMAQTKKAGAGPGPGSCAPCHADFLKLLPKTHRPVAGNTITACVACHKPDFQGKTEPNPFSARLHLAHAKTDGKADCMLCHTWAPGKQFGVKGVKATMGKVSKENMALLKKSVTSWASSSFLDAAHGKAGVVCLSCHGKTLPEMGDTVENDRCLACHGSLEGLQARSAPKDFPDRNPHKSHLGDIACTVCHHAHKASTVYCMGCHGKFIMKIPGAEQARP